MKNVVAKWNDWMNAGALVRPPLLLKKTLALQQSLRRLLDVLPEPPGVPARKRAVPGAPAGAATAVATFDSYLHTFDGATRRYKLFVPSRPARHPPLVVMLHGCKQDPDDFAAGTRVNEAAEKAGFLVAWPQQSRDANPQACWNWFGAREQKGGGEAALLADLTKTLVADHDVDPARVYIAGLSAGGAMAAIVAAANPDLFAAAAVHSGLPAGAAGNLPDALLAMRNGAWRHGPSRVPTIVFHGDGDRTVHPGNAASLIAAVVGEDAHTTRVSASVGAAAPYSRTDYVDAGGATRAELWSLHGAGHAWAGGDAAGSYTEPDGVDATAQMLRFFAEHRR